MRDTIRKLIKFKPILFLDQLLFRIGDDGIFAISGQLTYFLILSIFPFLIVLLNIISYTSIVQSNVLFDLTQYLPYEIQNIIESFVNDIVKTSSQGLLSFAAIAGLWTASSGVKPVIKAINKAYDFPETRSYVKLKLMSILFTISLLIILIISFIALVFGEVLGRMIFDYLGRGDLFKKVWDFARFVIPIIFMIFTFALLYKYSPNTKRDGIKLSRALPGGFFSTSGLIISSLLFSFYLNNFGKYANTYGSLGGFIVFLIWLYIIGIVILVGGEINATLRYFRLNSYSINEDMSIVSKFIN